MSGAAAASAQAPRAGLLGMLPDDRLVRRAAKGDERAFAAIFQRHHQALYRFCLAVVGDAQDAQDALQNTMVKVLGALPGEERAIELKPWLYRIARNESIELLRRRRDTPELDSEVPAPGPGTTERAETRARLRRLLDDLDELPERQRETLVMRELAGLPFAEIGAAIGASDAVARQTVYEARRSLRQMDEGRDMRCEEVSRALSDGDGRVIRGREVRAHLRACPHCRRFREEIDERRQDFAAISPLPAIAAAGILHGVLGAGSGGSGGAGLAAALGGSAGASAAAKGVATVAVVAAVGVGAADRGGLVDAGLPGGAGGSSQSAPAARPGDGSAASRAAAARRRAAVERGDRAAGTLKGGAAGLAGAGAVGAAAGSRRAGEDDGPSPAATAPSSAADAGPGSSGGGSGYANGKQGSGHQSPPSAAGHGQQTASSHKNAKHGSSTTKGGNASHPVKPSHSGKPASAGAGKGHPPKPPKPSTAGGVQPSPAVPEHAGSDPSPGGPAEQAP